MIFLNSLCVQPDGTDAYAHCKSQGKFKIIKRTEGISTTDILGRLLSLGSDSRPASPGSVEKNKSASQFLVTSRRLCQVNR